jgi:hypothetical protein
VATYQAIAATSQAILDLLGNSVPKPEFDGAQFQLYQASDFQNPLKKGISLYLYRVATNSTRRRMAPRVEPDGRQFRPPLPLDLHYVISAWWDTAAMQQRLLGWAMRALEDTPILPASVLNHGGPEAKVFRPDEAVELVCDPMSLQDMASVWEVFKTNLQPSVTYVARMIAVESEIEIPDARLVQTRGFNFGIRD